MSSKALRPHGAEPGDVVHMDGRVLGRHEGVTRYTIGQRRGLAIGRPAEDGKPRFVLSIRPVSNQVVVGPKEALAVSQISGGRYSWAGEPGIDLAEAFDCEVQIRAHADPVPAVARLVEITDDARTELHRVDATHEVVVDPIDPLVGVAPGQTAVLYLGTRVLGQFTIDRSVSATSVPA